MKKLFILLLLATASCQLSTMTAQTQQKAMLESKPWDNWYIGVNGGLSTKVTHHKWLDNLNSNAGIRVGRWFTPSFGLLIESNAYFGNKPQSSTGTIVKYGTLDLGATINLSNWWFGYPGEPRLFEVIAVPALGMGHVFGNESQVSQNLNDFTGKIALDFAFNVDKKKCVQIYLEPAMLYSIYGNTNDTDQFNLNVNRSHFQLNLGLVYRFKNTNGTHNFRYAEPETVTVTDYDEIDRLNARIAELEAENEGLRNAPQKEIAPRIITHETHLVDAVVAFRQGSSDIEVLQYANIEKVANYMKADSNVRVKVTGYASTEGSAELNRQLSEARAEVVKHALVSKYGVDADRIDVSGEGATDTLSEEQAYNRVAAFSIIE